MPNINQSLSRQQRQRTGEFDRQPQNTREARLLRRALRNARITQRAQARPRTLTQESQGLAAQAGEATLQSQRWLQGGIVARQARGPTSVAARLLFSMVLLNMIRPVGGTDTPPTTSSSDEANANADSTTTQTSDATSADPSNTATEPQAAQHHSEVLHADSFVTASRYLIGDQNGQVPVVMRFRNRTCLQRVLATIYEEERPSTTTEQATTDVTENVDSTATGSGSGSGEEWGSGSGEGWSSEPTEEPTMVTPTGLPSVSESHINWQSQDGNVVSGTLTRDQFVQFLAEAATNDDECLVSASVETIALPEVTGEIARQSAFDDAITALRAALGAGTQVCTSTARVVAQVSDAGGGYDQAEEVECVPVATHYVPPSSELTDSTLGQLVADICPSSVAIISDGIQAADVANNVESSLILGSPTVTENGISQVVSSTAQSSSSSATTTADGNSSFTSMAGNETLAGSGNSTTQQTEQDTAAQSEAPTRLTTEESSQQQTGSATAGPESGGATGFSTLADQLARGLLTRCPDLRLTSLQATQQPNTRTGHRARRGAEEEVEQGAVGGSHRVMSATHILQMLERIWQQAGMDNDNAPQIVVIAEVQEVAGYNPDFTEVANLIALLRMQGIVVVAYAATERSWLSRVQGVTLSNSLSEVLTLVNPDPPANNTEQSVDWSNFNDADYSEDESGYGIFDAPDEENSSDYHAWFGIAGALVVTLASLGLAFYCWGRRSRSSSGNTLSPPDLEHERGPDQDENGALLGSAIELQVMGQSDTDPAESSALLGSDIELQFMGESVRSRDDLYQRMTRRLGAASLQASNVTEPEESESEPEALPLSLLRFSNDDDSDNDTSSTSRRPSLVMAARDEPPKKQDDHTE